ncbi:hypothetical protein SAY86_023368 [Trapa natans]|uniref:Uncharacterized protein n=1 Tax=Trapa natans TaxID=22666 RepID=A0AAN7RBG7_TRANT|nr:hypothetical protein SAY86_023368 [Trapa natans]
MVAESWFRNLWGKPGKLDNSGPQKSVIGVLAFEFASLISKSVHLWQSLNDKNIARLREEIASSQGIKKLISDDEDCIANLIRLEMIENVVQVAKSVARFGQRCNDWSLNKFEALFEDMMSVGVDPLGWKYSFKKMETKVKKMERFVSLSSNLYQEMEVLADMEQTFRRMKVIEGNDPASLLEYQKKVLWKRQEVKILQESSLWNKSYDYMVLLLVRALFTIFSRIKYIFGIQQIADLGEPTYPGSNISSSIDHIYRSQSVSMILQASMHPAESDHCTRFASGPLGRSAAISGPILKANTTKKFYSGPLMGSTMKPSDATGKNGDIVSSYSGPIGKLMKSGMLYGVGKIGRGVWGSSKSHFSTLWGKKSSSKQNRLTSVRPMKGGDINSASLKNIINQDSKFKLPDEGNISRFSSKHRLLLNAPPDSLGQAGLALHYANVIIVIEKLAASPHLISLDARDDLYNMLPASVRSSLRARLKPYAKSLSSYDTDLAGEWKEAISGILDWLGPLAHNMIRWQSERSFEQQNLVSRANTLLVQTLYFANQEKTEAIITELLIGLNYIWRLGREMNSKPLVETTSDISFHEYLDLQGQLLQ